MAETEYFNDIWSVYFHDPGCDDWGMDSYKRICNMSTVDDFWALDASLQPFITRGMFFVMREHVFPCWDDPANLRGGCLSLKVPQERLQETWRSLLQRLFGETLVDKSGDGEQNGKADCWDAVNGISVSPKRCFNIIKLWLREGAPTTPSSYVLPTWYTTDILFRGNEESIHERNTAINANANANAECPEKNVKKT